MTQWTTGHCSRKKAPGGCQLHNLQCGYPECDRKPAMTPNPKVPLLTAEDAETLGWIIDGQHAMLRGDKKCPELASPKLKALATGQAVTVAVMTEDELRAEFNGYRNNWPTCMQAMLAIARAKGIVR